MRHIPLPGRVGALAALALLLAGCALRPPVPPPTGFTLTSPGRADNELATRPYGGRNPANPNCAGDNVSPALAWERPPAGTRSFAVLMDDQAGRAGLGVNHWVAYGIPAGVRGLPEGAATASGSGFMHGRNTLGLSYLGPCPPRGNAPQHYVFTLIATSLEPDALGPGLSKGELLQALQGGKALGAASFVMRYAH
ncbi:YbhB/YbcL family Raf kinase inhibitor-like protein [Aquabacterium sp. J223]|uniref:YbhB/YbcL family Raf kinase inhibitor-like protein n=1 Tax=Aquabacterium sp. J223 TaxID=2898431 RepID=UPI0021AD50F2|nr:YbhB/YbcL family Raf kinase inhibitor-like protein [Aquabacterium sp. J223]UUX97125.1 YbhB/YbcL family Raf kinase inhibitor-like protein [Aquabacterium sp. J223]